MREPPVHIAPGFADTRFDAYRPSTGAARRLDRRPPLTDTPHPAGEAAAATQVVAPDVERPAAAPDVTERRRVLGMPLVVAAMLAGALLGGVVALVEPAARGPIALAPVWVGAAIDLRTRRIPNPITAGTLVFGLAASAPDLVFVSLAGALLGGGVGVLLAIGARGAFGAGDIKLMAAAGAVLGLANVPALLMAMAVSGGLLAVAIVVARRGRLHGTMAYGPAIAIGMTFALLVA